MVLSFSSVRVPVCKFALCLSLPLLYACLCALNLGEAVSEAALQNGDMLVNAHVLLALVIKV